MKVKELVSTLRTLDPELDVICYCEREDIAPDKHGFRLFDINIVECQDAEKVRRGDGVPTLRLGKSKSSVPHALIEVTSDF